MAARGRAGGGLDWQACGEGGEGGEGGIGEWGEMGDVGRVACFRNPWKGRVSLGVRTRDGAVASLKSREGGREGNKSERDRTWFGSQQCRLSQAPQAY